MGRMFMEESACLRAKHQELFAEHYALLILSAQTSAAATRRRELSRGTTLCPPDRVAWIPAALRYLYLRLRLGLAESSMERKVRRRIRQLA